MASPILAPVILLVAGFLAFLFIGLPFVVLLLLAVAFAIIAAFTMAKPAAMTLGWVALGGLFFFLGGLLARALFGGG